VTRFSLLVLVLVIAGCGAETEGAGVPASSGAESQALPVETAPQSPTQEEPELEPPTILLISPAGKQPAAHGSYCMTGGLSSGVCADMAGPIHPEEMSVLHPGDRAIVALAGAFEMDEGSAVVRPLGCQDKETLSFDLTPGMSETHWRVQLEPGAYQLDVFTRFHSNDGRNGDVSGSLGLLIESAGPPRTVPVDLDLAVCPFAH
jgi:hypothetical protein